MSTNARFERSVHGAYRQLPAIASLVKQIMRECVRRVQRARRTYHDSRIYRGTDQHTRPLQLEPVDAPRNCCASSFACLYKCRT